jgi:hypothetical protein
MDIETSHSSQAKYTWLQAGGYAIDSVGYMDRVDNPGFEERKRMFSGSQTVQLITRLNGDLWNQPKLMITIEITPNDDTLVLQAFNTPAVTNAAGVVTQEAIVASTTTYVLEILSCYLLVKTMDLMDSLSLEFNQKLDKTPATYNIRKTVVKPLFISEGRYEFNGLLDTETVPRRVTLALVENSAFKGHKKKTPFAFKHYNVESVSIQTMGKQYPTVPYMLDYEAGRYKRAYVDMMDGLGFLHSQESNNIDPTQFANEWCIYVFNLTNSGEDEPNFELIKNACTNVNIKFKNGYPVQANGLVLIAYLEYDGIVMIDKNRSLTSDNTL